MHELACECQTVRQPSDMQKAIERAVRLHPANAVLRGDELFHHISALAAARQHLPAKRVALRRQRRQRAILREGRGAGVVGRDSSHASAGRGDTGCTSQPMRQPVIAQGLEKRLMTKTASSGSAIWRNDGACARCVIDQCAIDLVADDGDAAVARKLKHRSLLVARHHPAGGIAGRGDEDRLGARVAGIEKFFEIEPPSWCRHIPVFLQPHEFDFARRQISPPGKCWARPATRTPHCRPSRPRIAAR